MRHTLSPGWRLLRSCCGTVRAGPLIAAQRVGNSRLFARMLSAVVGSLSGKLSVGKGYNRGALLNIVGAEAHFGSSYPCFSAI